MGAGERTARAAFALAVALFALPLAPRSSAPAPCFEAAEQLARISHHPSTADAHLRTLTRDFGVRLLDVPTGTPPGPNPEISRQSTNLHALATRRGEKSGLAHAWHSVAVRCDGDAAARPLRGPARLLFGLRLDPNRADRASLEALPGIGPVRAAAIETERCRQPFASVAELERVPGIGPRSLARLEPWLALAAPAQARCAAVH